MLAWAAGAVALMAVGGVLAVSTWPRPPAPGVSVASPPTDAAVAPTDAMAREVAGDAISPPPLPPLPPSLESATSTASPAAPDDARKQQPERERSPSSDQRRADPVAASNPPPAAEAAAPGSTGPSLARQAPSAAPTPPSSPRPAPGADPADTRTSAEIMADFLVRSSGRAQAESTARAHSEWYAAGSRERAYWIQVLATIRSRP